MFAYFADKKSKKLSYGDFISAIIELRNEITDDIITKAFHTIGGDENCYSITK